MKEGTQVSSPRLEPPTSPSSHTYTDSRSSHTPPALTAISSPNPSLTSSNTAQHTPVQEKTYSELVFESPVRSGFLLPKQWTETGTGLYQFKDCKRLH